MTEATMQAIEDLKDVRALAERVATAAVWDAEAQVYVVPGPALAALRVRLAHD